MDPTETVAKYYETLRRGGPLASCVAEHETVVKFGFSERFGVGERPDHHGVA